MQMNIDKLFDTAEAGFILVVLCVASLIIAPVFIPCYLFGLLARRFKWIREEVDWTNRYGL